MQRHDSLAGIGPALPQPAAIASVAPENLLPGLALCAAIAMVAILVGALPWFGAHGLSALTLAIVFGLVVGNAVPGAVAAPRGRGIRFSKQTLLRAGIILYGCRLTLRDIGHVGVTGVLIDVCMVSSTFALACVLGPRVFGLDRATSMLIGAGSAICGAAAVMATEPVLRARDEQVTVAISTVVALGTLAIFVYPALYALSAAHPDLHWLPAGQSAFGIYAGSTIHEVAQVVAAAQVLGQQGADVAVITKMVRVMMLAPFLIVLGMVAGGAAVASDRRPVRRIMVPWFAVGFVAMVALNSVAAPPPALTTLLIDVDTLILAMAMAALGLGTQVAALRRAGVRPLLLATVLFAWLIGGGAFVNLAVTAWS